MKVVKFDQAITVAIKEAGCRLFNIMKNLYQDREADLKTGNIIHIVKKFVSMDYRRQWCEDLTRKYPINIGPALNKHGDTEHFPFKDANIYLIDSTTLVPNDDCFSWMKGLKIQAKSMRPYLPFRGDKGDNAYRNMIKKMLYTDSANADEIAEQISKTGMKYGNYQPLFPISFNLCAPRITLFYANMTARNRAVFMLRPSNPELRLDAYNVYSFVVAEALRIRAKGEIDLRSWRHAFPDEMKKMLTESLIVKDCQLVVREDEMSKIKGYDLSVPESIDTALTDPEILKLAA